MKMTNYFNECKSLDEAKKTYRNLVKANHPDVNPNAEETMKAINNAFEKFIDNFMEGKADAFNSTSDFDINSFKYAEMLKKVIHFNMEIEIIGVWIYARQSFEVKEELKALGFWFSSKHKAWVYSGDVKKKVKSRLTTNQVRNIHGSEMVKDKKETKMIS